MAKGHQLRLLPRMGDGACLRQVFRLDAVRQLGVTAICDKSFPAELVRRILDQLASTS